MHLDEFSNQINPSFLMAFYTLCINKANSNYMSWFLLAFAYLNKKDMLSQI